MCYITASGYNRMQQITDALNGMTPEMQNLASLNCVEEAVKILKNRGVKNKADCADNDGGRRREGDAGSGDKNQP